MRRLPLLLVSLGVLWSGFCAAAPLAPLELPPPDLVPVLPLAAPPLDKAPVTPLDLPLPDPPEAIPPLPAANVGRVDFAQRPRPTLPRPRILPCVGAFFGLSSSEFLECGRAHFTGGDLDEARRYLEEAAQRGVGSVRQEARFLLGEIFLRLDQLVLAERNFFMASQESALSGLRPYATLAVGWLALQLNDAARALAAFERLTRGGAPAEVAVDATHGRALALYALGRYAEAREAWQLLSTRSLPVPWAREVSFWLGESLGRIGEHAAAEEQLRRFTSAGLHPLLETGILRLGWSALAAGHHLESVKAFRWLLSAYPNTADRAWARAGLVMALLALDDVARAQEEVRQLQATDPTHSLLVPSLLPLLRFSVEKDQFALAKSLHPELLALNLLPATRSYVLLLNGEVSRRERQSGEARSQFDLARSLQPGGPLAWRATLRLAQIDLETREFARALDEVGSLLRQPLPPEFKRAALLLRGEVAYWGKAYETAAEGFGRFIAEFPSHPEVASATLSLGWAEFRLGRVDAARQRWLDFTRSFPQDPRAAEALLLAAELVGQAGDLETTRNLLDQILASFPTHPHAPVAKLNRAILELRAGRIEQGLTWLRELTRETSLLPFIGRVRLATGVALVAAGNPGKAAGEFGEALKQGEDVLAHLGLGSVALAQRQWRTAERHFVEARDLARPRVRLLAEYGAAAAAFHDGNRAEFARAATALMQSPLPASLEPRLAYVLAAIAVEDKRWVDARQWTLRLVNSFPQDAAADDALARLGAGAVAVKEWPLVRESYQLLVSRYPESPHAKESHLDLAEALLRTGAPVEARGLLEPLLASTTNDPRLPRMLLLLAEAQEAVGSRVEAIVALARLVREHPGSELLGTARMKWGRLLQDAGRWEESRPVWETVLNEGEAGARVEAAFRLGEGYRARELHEEAAEAYMTAAYLAPQTVWGRRALLKAGQSFVALKETNSAAIVYRKLLTQPGVEPELIAEAKRALQGLGQSP